MPQILRESSSVDTKAPTRDSLALEYQWSNEKIKLLTDIRFRLLGTRVSLALDYQWTNEQIKLLTDIRFRLLVLVPPLVAVGVTLLSNPTFGGGTSPLAMIGVGLLGLSITFGVVLYDLRNSQLYDALINRAMLVERKMRMDTLSKYVSNSEWGGPHAMRIGGFGRLFPVRFHLQLRPHRAQGVELHRSDAQS
jgi:hypothetical protein